MTRSESRCTGESPPAPGGRGHPCGHKAGTPASTTLQQRIDRAIREDYRQDSSGGLAVTRHLTEDCSVEAASLSRVERIVREAVDIYYGRQSQ